jgi:DNA-binding IscR family transcriptional regulator
VTVDCLNPDGACCEREATCQARNVWQSVHDCLTVTLGQMTLADIV